MGDLKKAIRKAHNYYNLRQSESSIKQIFVIKKENYEKLGEENRWVGDVASFCYNVVEIEKYKKYVHKILEKYYEEDKEEDMEEGNFVEGYYSIIEVEERERNVIIEDIKDICYDNEIFYINTRDKEFFKPYDLCDYKDYRKSKINGFILYHRGGLPPRLIDLIKELEK